MVRSARDAEHRHLRDHEKVGDRSVCHLRRRLLANPDTMGYTLKASVRGSL